MQFQNKQNLRKAMADPDSSAYYETIIMGIDTLFFPQNDYR